MRLRNVSYAIDKLKENNDIVVFQPEDKIDFTSFFPNDNEIHMEVGIGKGRFITTLARLNPHINYVGVEKYDSVLVRALERVELSKPENLLFICVDANNINNIVESNSIDRLYLNFSDPWPKNRHSKRRLTSDTFIDSYKKIMKDISEIHFKTDNRGLFEYSLESFNNYGLLLSNISLDLHNSDFEGNVETEYEEKFKNKGPIYRLEAKFK